MSTIKKIMIMLLGLLAVGNGLFAMQPPATQVLPDFLVEKKWWVEHIKGKQPVLPPGENLSREQQAEHAEQLSQLLAALKEEEQSVKKTILSAYAQFYFYRYFLSGCRADPLMNRRSGLRLQLNPLCSAAPTQIEQEIIEVVDDAVFYGWHVLNGAINRNFPDSLAFLLTMGEKPDISHTRFALKKASVFILAQLIDAGAPLDDPTDCVAEQPLSSALWNLQEDKALLLHDRGARPDKKYSKDQSDPARTILEDVKYKAYLKHRKTHHTSFYTEPDIIILCKKLFPDQWNKLEPERRISRDGELQPH